MKANFREDLCDSDRLYIFFGGIANSICMQPFEFYNAAKILNHNKIFIIDPYKSWYHYNIEVYQDYISKHIQNYKEIYWVGNSMGGFAALMFCAMFKTGHAIAFAPQIDLSLNDPRYYYYWHGIQNKINLCNLIKNNYSNMPANIYVSNLEPLDIMHAEKIKNFGNILINVLAYGGHSLVKDMRDKHLLPQILHP